MKSAPKKHRDAGLIVVRSHGDLVCDIPAMRLSNQEAKALGKEVRREADEKAFLQAVATHEKVLNRNLSSRERERLRSW